MALDSLDGEDAHKVAKEIASQYSTGGCQSVHAFLEQYISALKLLTQSVELPPVKKLKQQMIFCDSMDNHNFMEWLLSGGVNKKDCDTLKGT